MYLILSTVTVVYMNTLFTQTKIVADGAENIAIGYQLYQYGVYGMGYDSRGKPIPTLYREPVPPVLNAMTMLLHPGIDKSATLSSFRNGENQNKLKKVNLFWLLLLQLGVGLFVYGITKSKYLPFLAWFLLLFYFIRFGNHFDEFTTELQGATMIVWSSYFIYMALKKNSSLVYLLAGICFGLLILTKSVFFYLFPIVVIALYFSVNTSRKLPKFSLLLLGGLIVVGPWIYRNYTLTGEIRMTTRGGMVMYNRVLLNQISSEERKAAMYFWGPQIYKDLVNNTFLDINELEFELGGKFHVLQNAPMIDQHSIQMAMPEKTISYVGKMRAEYHKLVNEFSEQGEREARIEAHNILMDRSKEWIMEHPFKHTTMSLLFLWRGMWCFPNSTIPLINEPFQNYINEIINLLSYLSLIILLIVAIRKKDERFLALTIIPVLMLLFQAGASQNLARFSQQAIPSMLIALTTSGYFLLQRIDIGKLQDMFISK